MKKIQVMALAILFLIVACQTETKNIGHVDDDITPNNYLGDSVVQLAILVHGGEAYDEANFQFKFRDKTYQFTNFGNQYLYSRQQVVGSDTILDLLSNYNFERLINGSPIKVNEIESSKYSESINSVIYFATLPHKLSDKAVIKTYKGQTAIKKKTYNAVEISFRAEGGGKDHEDVFYYWLNAETHQIDYLAYQYATNGGGVRFRSAYNKRMVGGILFQDYVNYEVPIGTALNEIPTLYEKDLLSELSRIENIDIEVIK